jgi:ankyrin repeat protein
MLCGLDPQMKDRLRVDAAACSNIAQQLLDAGAQVNAQDRYGWSALHFAAANGMSEVASCLLQSGADLDTREKSQSRAPLMIAAAHGAWRVIEVLLAAGADPTAADGELHVYTVVCNELKLFTTAQSSLTQVFLTSYCVRVCL